MLSHFLEQRHDTGTRRQDGEKEDSAKADGPAAPGGPETGHRERDDEQRRPEYLAPPSHQRGPIIQDQRTRPDREPEVMHQRISLGQGIVDRSRLQAEASGAAAIEIRQQQSEQDEPRGGQGEVETAAARPHLAP